MEALRQPTTPHPSHITSLCCLPLPRSAFESSMEALRQPTIRVVAIIAEGVPERDTKQVEGAGGRQGGLRRQGRRQASRPGGRQPPAPAMLAAHRPATSCPAEPLAAQLIAYARANNKVIIGPATVGGVQASRSGRRAPCCWRPRASGAFAMRCCPSRLRCRLHCKRGLLLTRACLSACLCSNQLPPQAGSFKIGDAAGTLDNIVVRGWEGGTRWGRAEWRMPAGPAAKPCRAVQLQDSGFPLPGSAHARASHPGRPHPPCAAPPRRPASCTAPAPWALYPRAAA